MKVLIRSADLHGTVPAIASKSAAHRLLIAAALSDRPTDVCISALSADIEATIACLRALGADISAVNDTVRVTPLSREALAGTRVLDCGESGSTLRFLLPVAAALGVEARFLTRGRLFDRPLSPLWEVMEEHGARLTRNKDRSISVSGRLTDPHFTIAADVSSQYISGLLFAIPLMGSAGSITLTGAVESSAYIAMTIDALQRFGVSVTGEILRGSDPNQISGRPEVGVCSSATLTRPPAMSPQSTPTPRALMPNKFDLFEENASLRQTSSTCLEKSQTTSTCLQGGDSLPRDSGIASEGIAPAARDSGREGNLRREPAWQRLNEASGRPEEPAAGRATAGLPPRASRPQPAIAGGRGTRGGNLRGSDPPESTTGCAACGISPTTFAAEQLMSRRNPPDSSPPRNPQEPVLDVSGSYTSPGEAKAEGDWSNAAFWLVAGSLTEGAVRVTGLAPDSVQGDRAAHRMIEEIAAGGAVIDSRETPDLIPVLAVLASVTKGETVFTHAGRLRLKESDRIATTAEMIRALGGTAQETPEGIVVTGVRRLTGGCINSYNDHRIAMSAAIASIASEGEVMIEGAEAVMKSYPGFWDDFRSLGGIIEKG